MKNRALLVVAGGLLLAACGSSSPQGFVRAQARIGCKKAKKCDKSVWEQSDYGSVRECMDEQLEQVEEQFVDNCDDFDSKAARKCLAGMRKVKRTCDEDAASSEQSKACSEVCGEMVAWSERSIEVAIEEHAAAAHLARRTRTAAWLSGRVVLAAAEGASYDASYETTLP
jgi:hypothetical protein